MGLIWSCFRPRVQLEQNERTTENNQYRTLMKTRISLRSHTASELECMFYEVSRDSREHDLPILLELFLCAATKHDYRELVTVMLANKKYLDHRFRVFTFAKPLLVAMHMRNLQFVEVFLRAGASIISESFVSCTNANNTYYFRSAIERACVLNKSELFKVLMSCDKERNQERVQMLQETSAFSEFTNKGQKTVLDVILELSTDSYSKQLFSLPVSVKLAIDSGADVNEVNDKGFIFIDVLLLQLDAERGWLQRDRTRRHAIIDTVRVLITAGSYLNRTDGKGALEILLDQLYCYTSRLRFRLLDIKYIQLIGRLCEVIVANGGVMQQTERQGLLIIWHLVTQISMLPNCIVSSDVYHELMNNLGGLLHCFLLSNPGVNIIVSSISSEFVDEFATNARYPPSPGRPNRVLQLMLYSMSANELSILRGTLADQLVSKLLYSTTSRSQIKNALEWVQGVKTVLPLQNLFSRRKTRDTMSQRSLGVASTTGLRLTSFYKMLTPTRSQTTLLE